MQIHKSKLIKIAAELVQGANLPSEFIDDYPQKTYSASRVAQMMIQPHAKLQLMGIDIRAVADALDNNVDVTDMVKRVAARCAAIATESAQSFKPGSWDQQACITVRNRIKSEFHLSD